MRRLEYVTNIPLHSVLRDILDFLLLGVARLQHFSSLQSCETANLAHGTFLVCQHPVDSSVMDQYYRSCSLCGHGMENNDYTDMEKTNKVLRGGFCTVILQKTRKLITFEQAIDPPDSQS